MNWINRLFGPPHTPRPTPRLRQYATITEEELLSRLLAAPDSPLYQAVLVVVDGEILELNEQAIEEGRTEAQLRELLGGARALTDLKQALEDKISEARDRERQRESEQTESKQ